jgi:glycosyltransferase involved in cell wall biosynthesis
MSPARRVSLIMPVWRPQPSWLRQAVSSALAQDGVETELVLVDDGNEEPVACLLSDITDGRLQVLRLEHGGVAEARNAGISAASGTHFRFLDADDVFDRHGTRRLLDLLDGADNRIAYGATLFCDADLNPVWKLTCTIQGEARERCLLGRFTVRLPALLFPRRVVEATGEWDPALRVSQDWDYVLRALEHATVSGETFTAARYRRNDASATGNVDAGAAGGRRVLEKYFERHPSQRGSALARKAEAALEATLARAYLTRGARRQALRAATRAFARDPLALPREAARALPALRSRTRPSS